MTLSTTSVRRVATRLWKLLGSMTFAVAMLFVVAVAASVGSLVDQNQAVASDVTNFGALWTDVYRLLGIDDVYHAAWFLALLAALTLSTGICVWRNTPMMWREWRSYKAERTVAQMTHGPQHWMHIALPHGMGEERFAGHAARVLRANGYRVVAGPGVALSAKRGLERRLGYILAHAAIVVLCLGGLVDGNIPLKWRLAHGALALEKRDVAPSLAAPSSRIPDGGGAFRGALRLADGQVDDLVSINLGDGFLVRRLPFRLRLDRFDIAYHPGGQPRDFVSEVEILDRDSDRVLKKMRLSVNHPGEYEGVSLFQSGFDDGGTSFHATVLDGAAGHGRSVEGVVGQDIALLYGGDALTLEARGFHPKNVVPEDAGTPSLKGAFLAGTHPARRIDLGRSLVFGIRDGAGQASELTSFLDPVRIDGSPYLVTELRRPGVAAPDYLRLPLDATGTLDTYQHLIATLGDPVRRDAIAARLTQHVGDAEGVRLVRESLAHGFETFFDKGLGGLVGERPDSPSTTARQRDEAGQALAALMARASVLAYLDLHPGADPRDAIRFCADSLVAYSTWLEVGRPPLIRVDALTPRSATVLQVTQSPGRVGVYLGMGLLSVGIALLVLLQERRVWIRRAPATGEVVVALSSNRPSTLLDAELRAIVDQLEIDVAGEWPLPNLLS